MINLSTTKDDKTNCVIYEASVMCPTCSIEVKFKKMVEKTNIKKRWIISNLIRHIKKHSETTNDHQQNSEQNDQFPQFSTNTGTSLGNRISSYISEDNFYNRDSVGQENFGTTNHHSNNYYSNNPTTIMGHSLTVLSSLGNVPRE